MEQLQSEQVYNVDAHALVCEEFLHCLALLTHSLQNAGADITYDHEDVSHSTRRRQETQGHATSAPANDAIILVSEELLMLLRL